MICITVAPQSRTLAKADLLNASRLGDIVELCLDGFVKDPDVKDLIEGIPKPILISCRRPEDGGEWRGSEEERLMLLRQAIAAGPAFVELDLEIAGRIPRFGKVQRVISFTRLDAPETDIDRVFYEASNAKADIVKFTWPTPTIDDAWPLLAAVTQKRILPVVGMGLGRSDLTFSLLGKKYGSAWTYAALERGLEAFKGQATVFELDETYHYRDIGPKTMFIAVAGFGPAQTLATQTLNDAFRKLDSHIRCLPIAIGDVNKLKKMLDVLKIKAILVPGEQGGPAATLAEHQDEQDRATGVIDLLLKRDDGWHGHNTLWRAALKSLEAAVHAEDGGQGLDRQNVLVIGNGGLAQCMVRAVTQRKGLVSICGPGDKQAHQIARDCNCRFIPFHNLYETLADVVLLADAQVEAGVMHGQLNPSVLRPGMTVMDVGRIPEESELIVEARQRGCKVVDPAAIFQQQLQTQFKAITGQDLPR